MARSQYLCPPGTRWVRYAPGTGFPFRRLLRLAGTTVEVFYAASTRGCSSCRAPSVTRGRVCNLQCNLWLVRSLRTNNHTLPSHLRLCSFFIASYVEVEVEIKLRPTVSRTVRLGVRHASGTRDQFFFLLEIFFRQLRVCYSLAPSLTRGRVCNLLYNYFWALHEQSLLGRSRAELTAIKVSTSQETSRCCAVLLRCRTRVCQTTASPASSPILNIATSRQTIILGHKFQSELGTKAYWLTGRQSWHDFDLTWLLTLTSGWIRHHD
jgi:hypothetical protein